MGGHHGFSSKSFCLTVPKITVGEHFGVSGKFRNRKNLCIREGEGITFLRRKLFVTQYRKISLGNTSVYQRNSGIEKLYAREREGGSRFTVENFLSHSTEKFRWGTLRCIRKFRLSKNFMHQRGRGYHISQSKNFFVTQYQKMSLGNTSVYRELLGIEKVYASEKDGVSHFSVENFLSHSTKNFVGAHFGVSGNFGCRKILCIREGGVITFLSRKLFVTQYQKMSLVNTSVYQKISGIEKLYASETEGVSHFSIENFLSHSTKISLGHTSVYREISGVEKISASEREGLSHFSVENFLSHSTRKCRWGTLRCIRNFRISKQFMHQREREREVEREREKERGGKYCVSPSKTFCLTVPIKFLGELFCVSKDFWYRIFEAKGGGSFTVLSNFFLSNRTEKTSPRNQSDSGKLW